MPKKIPQDRGPVETAGGDLLERSGLERCRKNGMFDWQHSHRLVEESRRPIDVT